MPSLAIWRYAYDNVRPHSSLGNKTSPQKRAERFNYLKAPRPERLPHPKPANIKPKDSHYD
jgi:hypothetical protein